ncbi:MAG TPA: Gfo/Idh/MocA family oxidoreductase [Candidatus Sulfopaludibacter sp.]|jgi:predicted dehydrogenase|nr:Gfo/Idh/MocA family oxidoreductase [Candidatus Sulfopaludibacter sp.]
MVNWLVIGIGDITRKRVIPAILAEPRSQLYGVVTRDPRKAEAYPGVRVWTSLEEALQDDEIHAVYVASPVALHSPHAIACLRAGKDVLCEKPVGMNYPEARDMVTVARECRRIIGVSYYRRLYPKLIRAKQLIEEGAIGQPVLAEANCQTWLDITGREWLVDPAMSGGGPLYDTGSHRIDALNFLFGRPVKANGMRSNAMHHLAVEDCATVMIEYASKVRAVVDVRWNSHVARDQFRVIGTEGEIKLDPLNGPALLYPGGEEQLPPHANFHYPSIENFVKAVLDGSPLACPGEEAIWTDWVTAAVK